MQITIEAETDEEKKLYPEPIIWPMLVRFGVAGCGAGGEVEKSHGDWTDVQGDLARLHARVERQITHGHFKHLASVLLDRDKRDDSSKPLT